MLQSIKSMLSILVALAPTVAFAQDLVSDVDFVGIKGLRITASPLNVYSIDCNIENTYLMRELQRQFEAEGVAIVIADDTLAVVSILSAREAGGGSCNSSIMLGAYKKASFFDDDAGWLRTGYVVIWQSALLITSPAETHLALSRDALARLGESMLNEWRMAGETTSAQGSK
jgi:hypothetical protein